MGLSHRGVKDLLYLNPDMLSIEVVRDFERKALAQTDFEALEFAWGKFGHYDEFTLSKKSLINTLTGRSMNKLSKPLVSVGFS